LTINAGDSIIQANESASHISAKPHQEVLVIARIHVYQAQIALFTAAISSSTCETMML